MQKDLSYKTAIKRNTLSRPVKYLLDHGKISKDDWILDYGCGHGDDINWLKNSGYNILGWDPFWYKNIQYMYRSYNVVLCTYVFNVVNKKIRQNILKRLKDLTYHNGTVYITVRRDLQKNHTVSKRGTNQYIVKLSSEIIRETSSYCIYKI